MTTLIAAEPQISQVDAKPQAGAHRGDFTALLLFVGFTALLGLMHVYDLLLAMLGW